MNPNKAVAAALVAALLTLAQPAPRASAPPQQQSGTLRRDSVVFVVTKGNATPAEVEPAAVINGRGAIAEPALGASADGGLSAFLVPYYKPGVKYRLVFGGAEAGTLTVREVTHADCSPNTASVDVDSATAKLGGKVMALATDGPHTLRAQSSRRAPTDAERAAAFGVAKRILAGKRVSASERNTRTLNLTASDLDGDGREELIGSYVVKTGPQVRDTLFLVAAPQGRGHVPALTKYARVKASEMMDPTLIGMVDEGSLAAELYIEQLDADGDGVGEVFTSSDSFEGTTFRAYRRQRGAWRAVYENYSYRCAY